MLLRQLNYYRSHRQRPVTLRLSTCERCVQRSIVNCRRRTVSIPQRFEADRTPSRVEDRLARDPPTSKGSLLSDLRFAIHVCHSPQCGRRSRRVGDTAASPGGLSQVFKRYSQMKLQMKREALEKISRQANEMPLDSGTAMVQ